MRETNLFVFGAVLLLECPAIFHMIQANIHSNDSELEVESIMRFNNISPCQKRHEGPLLQLVDEDGGVGLSSWSDCQSRGSIPYHEELPQHFLCTFSFLFT